MVKSNIILKTKGQLLEENKSSNNYLLCLNDDIKALLLSEIFDKTAILIIKNYDPNTDIDDYGNPIPVGTIWVSSNNIFIKLADHWKSIKSMINADNYDIRDTSDTMYINNINYICKKVVLNGIEKTIVTRNIKCTGCQGGCGGGCLGQCASGCQGSCKGALVN